MKIRDFIRRNNERLHTLKYLAGRNAYINSETKGNGGLDSYTHVTYCSVWNSGDTVLSQCVRRALMHEIKIKEWNLVAVDDFPTDSTVQAINNTSKVIIGGGGLFLPDTNSNDISGWQWAISKDQLNAIEVPVCIFSVGYNYFRGQKPNDLFVDSMNFLVGKSSFFGLRNMGSVHAIQEMIDEKSRDKVKYQPCTTTLIRKLYNTIPPKTDSNNVAINVAFDREDLRYGDKKDIILSRIASGIKQIENKGYNIYCVFHCSSDEKFIPYLDAAGVKYKIADLSREYPDKTYAFYNSMDVVFGMRGHAQMIPFGLNCEIISLGSHDKLRWFLEDIEAPEWYIELNNDPNTISDEMIAKFEEIHEKNRLITKEHLQDQQKKLWEITIHNIDLIRDL